MVAERNDDDLPPVSTSPRTVTILSRKREKSFESSQTDITDVGVSLADMSVAMIRMALRVKAESIRHHRMSQAKVLGCGLLGS